MKRKDLLKKLAELGCTLVRHGSNHDWYTNPKTQTSQAVPRHNEIDEYLAKAIIKALSKQD
ncbi:MAG TPA: type II toxin-antitoxin system HicA family toxin [Methylobacter sp.]|jgi:predicted RNA binding protein YcfA (HicA-like mRNA interferase family)